MTHLCVCGHPADDHQPHREHGWVTDCCTTCNCPIYERGHDQ